MNDGDAFVEQVVQGVMAELRARPDCRCADHGSEPSAPSASCNVHPDSQAVALSENVITQELLEDQAAGASAIEVAVGSIVTPSARDYMAQQNIACHRANRRPSPTEASAKWLAVVVNQSDAVSTALDDSERSFGIAWTRESAGSVVEAVALVTLALRSAHVSGAVVFSSHPSSIACCANRDRSVRGAVVGCVSDAQCSVNAMGANLFCIDPSGKGHVELRNLLRVATACAAPSAPAGWEA